MDSVTNFFNWMTWDNIIKLLRDAFAHAFEWLWNFIAATFGAIWAGLAAAVSAVAVFLTMLQSAAAPMAPYFNFVNAWFPLDVLVTIVSAYTTFWVALVTYKFVKSWIPTVSGGG